MKKVVMVALRSGAVGLSGLVLAMTNCVSLAGFEEGIPSECSAVEECATQACRTPVACKQGECVFENAPEGTAIAQQQQGDCVEIVCDGAGKVTTIPLATDQPEGGVCAPCGDGSVCGVCGDGKRTPEGGEECDDGGRADGDRCSATCKIESIEALAAGGSHTCAILYKRRVIKCWGLNSVGELGLGDISNRGDAPDELGDKLSPLNFSKPAVAIVTGDDHACALLSDDRLICWGDNEKGQLGVGDMLPRGDEPGETADRRAAVSLGTGQAATAIAAGYRHTCVILNDGGVKCWGENASGQLGLGDIANRGNHPDEMGDKLPLINLGTEQTARAIAAGDSHTCALLDDGSVKCWGENASGQLGLGDITKRGDGPNEMGNSLPAINLGAGKIPTAITAGENHTCALLSDGSVKCWGDNSSGQLGRGDTINRGDVPGEMGDSLPAIDLGAGKTATAIAAGASHTCALLNDGSLKCWGANYEGQLGRGDLDYRGDGPGEMGDKLPPIDLGAHKVVVLSSGLHHVCAILDDDSVKCWGGNQFGELGLGDVQNRGTLPNQMGENLPTVKLF